MSLSTGIILQHAITCDPKRNVDIDQLNQLPNQVEQLLQLLDDRHTPFVLVGGVAMLSYIEGRNTQDLDFIMSRESLERLPELAISDEDQNFARAMFGDVQVDLLLTNNRLFQIVQQQHVMQQPYGDRQIWTATPEGLMLLKLYALPSLYRQGQFQRVNLYEGDLLSLMMIYPISLERCVDNLRSHLIASDIEALRDIAQELSDRLVRMQHQRSRFDQG
jgi:hypothetical protein